MFGALLMIVKLTGVAAGTKVKAAGSVAAAGDPTFVTARSTTAPADPTGYAGVIALICPGLVTWTLERLRPPSVTRAPGWKLEPRIVTAVPPDDGPLVGVIEATEAASAWARTTSGRPMSPCTTTPWTVPSASIEPVGGVKRMW